MIDNSKAPEATLSSVDLEQNKDINKSTSNNYWRISVSLTGIASALWAISLFQMFRSGLSIDDLGLINTLPITFWMSIGMLTVASAMLWTLKSDHPGLLFLQISLFLCMLWFTPLIEGHTLFGTRDAFAMHSLTQNILETSQLNPETMWYHNWPAGNLLEAAIIQICGIQNIDPLLIYAVIPVQLLIIIALFIFFRYTFGENNYWAAAGWFFLLFNWTGSAIYSPQGIALLMFILTLGLYLKLFSQPDRFTDKFLVIILFFGLTVTHLLTSLGLLFITIAFAVMRKKGFFTLAMIFTVMLAIWLFYYSTAYFTGHFSRLLDRILDLGNMFFQNLTVSEIGSEGHQIMVSMRMYYTIFAGILGVVGLIISWWKRHKLDGAFLAMLIALLVMLPVQFYERELFSRIYLYMLPALAYFTIKFLHTRGTVIILVLLILVSIPFGIVSLHGNQRWNTLPPEQLSYIHFLEENTYQGFEPYYQTSLIWLIDQPESTAASQELIETPLWRESIAVWRWLGIERPDLVSITSSERAMFWLFADAPNAVDETLDWLKKQSSFDYVYSTGTVDAFRPK